MGRVLIRIVPSVMYYNHWVAFVFTKPVVEVIYTIDDQGIYIKNRRFIGRELEQLIFKKHNDLHHN